MHEIDPPGAELLDLVAEWMPAQRWYPLKGVAARVEAERSFALADGVHVHLLRLVTAEAQILVHVPVVVLSDCGQPRGPAHIGSLSDGTVHLVDGPAHPRYWRALLSAAHWDGPRPQSLDTADGRLVAGEQSNSSIILPRVGGGVIAKVLRTVGEGPNPDLTVPLALTRAGWGGVPAPRAWLALDPRDAAAPDATLLAVVAELVADADDGFELACAMAGRGEEFATLATDLGRTIAAMHDTLARALPRGRPLDPAWLLADLRRRAAEALEQSAALASRRDAISRFHDRTIAALAGADAATLPRLQAVHGDLHLGQVLHAADGWRVLDFEGEPLRPPAERTRLDLALRDVAGVLRSFDYAAVVGRSAASGWADRGRRAFLDAYWEHAGRTPSAAVLLDALTLDKALYEVVYESRNRPDWEPIPLAAVDALLSPG